MTQTDAAARYVAALANLPNGIGNCDYCTKPATHTVADKLALVSQADGSIVPANGLIRSPRCNEHSASE